MRIADIQVTALEYELEHPITNAMVDSLFSRLPTYVIRMMTDEGIDGLLVTDYLNALSVRIITDFLKPLVVGEDPMEYERLWEKMFGHEAGWRHPVTKGEVVKAMSAVDCVVWDIIGKRLNVPVYQLLGGAKTRVPCYASGGHYKSLTSLDEELRLLEEEMTHYTEMGFRAVKMRIGRDLRTDRKRAELARRTLGPDVDLLFDLNTSQTYRGGAKKAIQFLRAFEEFDPYWFEDPLIMDDIAGMRRIADAIDTPIASGEMEQTVWGFRDMIAERAVDILICDPTGMCGGITQWRKIAAMAEAVRIPVASHIGDKASVHCVTGVPNGLIVEVFLPLEEERWAYDRDPIKIAEDGMISAPQTSGLGIELDPEYVDRHLVQ